MAAAVTVSPLITAKRLKIKSGGRVLGRVNLKTPFPILEDHSQSQPINLGSIGDPTKRSCVADREKRGRSEVVDDDRPKKKQKPTEEESMRCLCSDLLGTLMEHQYGWAFCRPVDPKALNLPDYMAVISEPMDLETIKSRLEKQEYVRVEDFGRDVRLTFSNAMMYAQKSSKIHRMASVLLEIFEARWNLLAREAQDENPKTNATYEDESRKTKSNCTEGKMKTASDGSKGRGEASTTIKASRYEILRSPFKDTIAKAQAVLSHGKRNVEKERTAARTALSRLEKMVDVEDNIRYEKELERLCRFDRGIYKLEYFGLFLKDV